MMTGLRGRLAQLHSKVSLKVSMHMHQHRCNRAHLTLNIELRRVTGNLHEEVEIVLHPKPTIDPNDPLVRSQHSYSQFD